MYFIVLLKFKTCKTLHPKTTIYMNGTDGNVEKCAVCFTWLKVMKFLYSMHFNDLMNQLLMIFSQIKMTTNCNEEKHASPFCFCNDIDTSSSYTLGIDKDIDKFCFEALAHI